MFHLGGVVYFKHVLKGRRENFMKPCRKKVILLLSFTILFTSFGLAFGGMVVLLKNGRTVNVPVNKEDIVSISFDQASQIVNNNITWDFESGNLLGWIKTGTAFDTQPTYGDNPTARHRGQPSQHQGNYWIGSFENRHRPSEPPGRIQGDGPQGTLTSQPFVISSPVISFLVGGGCDMNTERVVLVINGRPVLKSTGKCSETMNRVSWNVHPYKGQTAQIRLVDSSSGGWGHINFDDVNFR
jgi:hypothetical protein